MQKEYDRAALHPDNIRYEAIEPARIRTGNIFEVAYKELIALKEENLICVTPEDYGYWEAGDKVLSTVAGFHGILPNMNMIHRLIVRFLKDEEDHRKNTWGRKAPGVKNWEPPIKLV